MAEHSTIEWTDATWNPITGCSVVSPGCTNCYAMRLAGTRLAQHPSRAGLTIETKAGPVWTGEVRLNEQWLDQPLRWRRPRRIFPCAHGDLFHPSVPVEWIDRVFAVMALGRRHEYQVLTKRSDRMRTYLGDPDLPRRLARAILDLCLADPTLFKRAREHWPVRSIGDPEDPDDVTVNLPLPNVWLGVSAEDQRRADERIPDLLATPAAVRFVSAEPLLGPVDLTRWLPGSHECGAECGYRSGEVDSPPEEKCQACFHVGVINGEFCPECGAQDFSFVCPDCGSDVVQYHPDTPNLDWVIVGGESGRDARPMHPQWATNLLQQCRSAGVAFFMKQMALKAPIPEALRVREWPNAKG